MTGGADDREQARIVVTMPVRPSYFESALAKLDDSGVLIETMETFLHLSRRSVGRLVVVSPFLDEAGLDWVLSLFEAAPAMDRALICRHVDQIMPHHVGRLTALKVKIYEYYRERTSGGGRSRWSETFHAKIVLADQVAAYVGSANLLKSSKELSLECGVLLEGRAVKQVYDVVESMLQVSKLVKHPQVAQTSN